MIALAPRSAAFSSAVPALRLQRVVARLRERATDQDIAEGPSRERLRQIAAAARGKARPIPKRMRFASNGRCVWPRAASRMATRKPLLLNLVDRLRLSCDPGHFNDSL